MGYWGPARSFPPVSSTPVDGISRPPRREDARRNRQNRSDVLCRRVTPRSRLNQRLRCSRRTPRRGKKARRGLGLNVPNVNYASGVPVAGIGRRVLRPKKSPVRIAFSLVVLSVGPLAVFHAFYYRDIVKSR